LSKTGLKNSRRLTVDSKDAAANTLLLTINFEVTSGIALVLTMMNNDCPEHQNAVVERSATNLELAAASRRIAH
jgi:hypothetical protein